MTTMSCCRICLCKEPSRDLLQCQDNKQLNGNGEKPSCEVMMLFCLGIQIAHDEKSSTKLCELCYKKLIGFYKFKVLALKNIKHFMSIDSKSINIVTLDNNIKKEELSDEQSSDDENHNDQEEEPLVYYAEDIKDEYKQENASDDEFMSGSKNKFQTHEIANNQPIRKRGRPRKTEARVKPKAEPIKICDYCGKKVRDLKQHLREHAPLKEKDILKCDLCDKTFTIKASIARHIQRAHFPTKHKCHICGKEVAGLKLHMLIVHNKDKLRFECDVCHHRFATSSILANHKSVHTKVRPFQCEQCLRRFRTNNILKNHIQEVHNRVKRHLCQYCPKSFWKKGRLQEHLSNHTNEKPLKCDQCDKRFATAPWLQRHQLLHATDRKYVCNVCDKAFSVLIYFQRHVQRHTAERKYPCRFCDHRFTRADNRKQHEFNIHKQRTTASTSASVL